MKTIHKAVISSSAAQYGTAAIALVSSMLVARLLTPGQIGTFAIASAVVGIMAEFKMLGAGAYLIRENEIDAQKIRRALGLTLIISWGLGLLIFFGAPLIQTFYGVEGVAGVFRILSISFFAAPFFSIAMALMHRQFDFNTPLKLKLIGAVTGLVVTLVMIYFGFSFYALAWGAASIILIQLAVACFIRSVSIYWVPRFDGILSIARFGIFNSSTNLLKNAVSSLPDMIIGKMGTTTQVGLFSRGLGLVKFLSGTIQMGATPVALPYLSNARRQGSDIVQAYTIASQLLTAVVWPVLAVAAVASLPTMRLFFGDQWDEAALLASWLALWLILRSTHHLANNLLIASGFEKWMLAKEFAVFLVVLFMIPLAFQFGLVTVAKGFVLAGIVEVGLVSWMLRRLLKLSVRRYFASLSGSIGMTLVCGAVTVVISWFIDFETAHYWKPILVIAVILPLTWIASALVLRHPIAREIRYVIGW